MKCLTTRGICGGYYIKPRKNQSWRHRRRLAFEPKALQACLPVTEPAVGLSFEDDYQIMYFDEWRYLAEAPLSGFISSKLWSTFMPQLTSQSIVLRHAALGIGAMSHALSAQSAGHDADKHRHYQSAIEYYCKAIRSLAESSHSAVNTLDAVLLSILFATFESLCRNTKSALKHVSHGLSMIRDLCSGPNAMALLNQLAPEPGELMSEVVSLYSRLGVQTQIIAGGRIDARKSDLGTSRERLKASPEEMHSINSRLDRYFNPRQGLGFYPETFSNSEQALEYWVAMTRRIETMGPDIVRVVRNLLNEDATDHSAVEKAIDRFQNSSELRSYTSNACSQLGQWRRAYWPLYQRHGVSHAGEISDWSIVSLYVEYLALSIHSNVAQYGDYDYVESITAKCRDIVKLCEVLLCQQSMKSRRPASMFTMHTGLTWHLTFVAINCRDADVRLSAMRVLETYPRHDGLWSSYLLLEIGKKSQEIEAENITEESSFVQWRRLCRRVYLFEEAGSKLIFRFMRMDEETGQWEYIEEFADTSQSRSGAGGLEWRSRPLSSQKFTLQWGRTADAASGSLWPGMGCVKQVPSS
ncbi:unnamed protein product [Clonostachys byssicola]|uniref:C6 zinc finger domain protein n=1 Tax=Clonostachys byssicola TaxID=160290 RepID=A0A9N9Y2H2_9HYPO|nr:unnamed protein product [Clonostachys byssicola]